MNMTMGKNLNNDDLKKVSGGTGNSGAEGIFGMENFAAKRTVCPRCNSADLKDKAMSDSGKSQSGQICRACGYSWTYSQV